MDHSFDVVAPMPEKLIQQQDLTSFWHLYWKTVEGAVITFANCEDDKDGIEVYRLLASHCDQLSFNTNNALMEAITRLGRRKVSQDPRTAVEEILITVRDVNKLFGEHETCVSKFLEAKGIWIPSMVVELMDASMLIFVGQQGVSVILTRWRRRSRS